MREIAVRLWDDLDWAEQREKNEAAGTVLVGLDGRWRELDLTAAHLDHVRATLETWMAAGHKPDSEAAAATPPPRQAPRRISPESREYGRAIREFADKQDPPLNYLTQGGSYYYGAELRMRFADYLAETDPGSPMAVFARDNSLTAGNQVQMRKHTENKDEDRS